MITHDHVHMKRVAPRAYHLWVREDPEEPWQRLGLMIDTDESKARHAAERVNDRIEAHGLEGSK
jgi:hypothetical protein